MAADGDIPVSVCLFGAFAVCLFARGLTNCLLSTSRSPGYSRCDIQQIILQQFQSKGLESIITQIFIGGLSHETPVQMCSGLGGSVTEGGGGYPCHGTYPPILVRLVVIIFCIYVQLFCN